MLSATSYLSGQTGCTPAGSFGALPQDRLETRLSDEQTAAWANGVDTLVKAWNECGI